MNIQPSSFIKMIQNAESVQAVEHIYSCVDDLFGYEYSPEVEDDIEWHHLMAAKDNRIIQLTE